VSVGLSLGLTSKRASRALAAFAAKYRIRETFAQQGKAQIKVCCPKHAALNASLALCKLPHTQLCENNLLRNFRYASLAWELSVC